LSTRNDEPARASRPFDADRDGFVVGEGSGILIFEALEHAEKRGAKILAEIVGYGMTGDANHITQPAENGDGAFRVMCASLRDAKVRSEQVGYVNAHGTSTPLGDAAETRVMRSKEEAHDYRYFPEPDLPPLEVSDEFIAKVRDAMPELPDFDTRRPPMHNSHRSGLGPVIAYG